MTGPAADPGASLDPARRAPRPRAARVLPRADARARALPVPDRSGDRVHAEPARPRPARAPGFRAGSGCWSSTRSSRPPSIGVFVALRQRRRRPEPHRRRPGRHVPHRGVERRGRPAPSWTSNACRPGSTPTGSRGSKIQKQFDELVSDLSAGELSGYVQDALVFARGRRFGAIVLLFAIILVVVISIYMLLDMPRLEASIDRRFPPHDGLPLTQRIERALWGYVKGQVILSTVIGLSAGVGMWVLGTTGLVEGAERYALLFGVWTALVEVVPYIGPWLSAVPPRHLRARRRPGRDHLGRTALRLHLPGRGAHRGAERDGERAAAAPAARHLRAARRCRALRDSRRARGAADDGGLRAIWEFFRERVELEPWDGGRARR